MNMNKKIKKPSRKKTSRFVIAGLIETNPGSLNEANIQTALEEFLEKELGDEKTELKIELLLIKKDR